MFHADNAYYYPAYDIATQRRKTNTVSNTAFRGFGGTQMSFALNSHIDTMADMLGLDPVDIHTRNALEAEVIFTAGRLARGPAPPTFGPRT